MKFIAEEYLDEIISQAIISVPSYFDDHQRYALRSAGTLAGFSFLRVVSQPYYAVFGHGLNQRQSHDEAMYLVYDVGAVSTEVSLISIEDNVFELLASSGDTGLGGNDFNERVIRYLISDHYRQTGHDLAELSRHANTSLFDLIENAKLRLSTDDSTSIALQSHKNTVSVVLTREQFDSLNIGLFNDGMKHIDEVMAQVNLTMGAIEGVILTGGSTHIPALRQLLTEYIGKAPITSIDPAEAVVRGAATVAGRIRSKMDDLLVSPSISPFSIGFGHNDGEFLRVIHPHAILPVTKIHWCTTVADNQNIVRIPVYTGESSVAHDNYFLGELELQNIPPQSSRVNITFELAETGNLTVHAQFEDLKSTVSETIDVSSVWMKYYSQLEEQFML
ncbi:hypothetical protein HGRIS_002346 [Hohenbuehelia grisea]|uniref:Uncharacterized protein n=1 Tax=Hohenbuehelia grisea TaxID=104357 RepID=A0ABR3JKE3_9AGAR